MTNKKKTEQILKTLQEIKDLLKNIDKESIFYEKANPCYIYRSNLILTT